MMSLQCVCQLCAVQQRHLNKGSVHVVFLPHQLQLKTEGPCGKRAILATSTFLAGAVGSYSMSYPWS